MNFRINVKGLLEGIKPAEIVSTTGIVNDHPTANHICLEATPECLFAIANGGRVSVKNPIPYMTTYCTDYAHKSSGSVSVKTSDLLNVLTSFPETEVLSVEATDGTEGHELIIRPSTDPEEFQTLPCVTTKIEVHKPAEKFSKQITIDKQLFVRGLNRVLFAGGFEEKRAKFLYWVLRADTKAVRFAAGSGARFAILDMRGEYVATVKGHVDMLIPVEPSHTILKLFKEMDGKTVTIKQSTDDIQQYVVELDALKITIAGFDPGIEWVDESVLLRRSNCYRFTVPLKDYGLATAAVSATLNEEEKAKLKLAGHVHVTTLTLNTEKRIAELKSTGTMKAVRKIKLTDLEIKDEQPTLMTFQCVTPFLNEITKHADNSDFIQFEMVNKDKPLVVRFYSDGKVASSGMTKVNSSLNIEEEFSMFVSKLNESKQ